ncbi:hypothetical protein BDV30DRAFT_208644 [Aspergillus minisclerotigenes]|uniref:DUF1907 domain-containing protein n=1 Tax=Aspergillus minisclerotigenes TaxID=656917 RepID=A0A5N6J7A6_9EURO|nr:hypothetical protein BDV30DRAFT_208644 [Aspergillus minisclerotigenes]
MNTNLPVKRLTLDPPPLSELSQVIGERLSRHFGHVAANVVPCPDLRQPPFHLAGEGLCGNERIADVGGPPHLRPSPRLDKKYSLPSIMKMIEMRQQSFVLGAAAGPFHVIGQNSELMPNLARGQDGEWQNETHYAKVNEEGQCHLDKVPDDSTDFGLMANLFASDGLPGDVIHIRVKRRTGDLNFTEAIQDALKAEYGERPISLGGIFLVRSGTTKLHVMTDFSSDPCPGPDHEWFKYYDSSAPLICLTVFHSVDSESWDLRMGHTHCFSTHGMGGHYHYDTTAEEVEYEAWLNTAKVIYRIDQPGQ